MLQDFADFFMDRLKKDENNYIYLFIYIYIYRCIYILSHSLMKLGHFHMLLWKLWLQIINIKLLTIVTVIIHWAIRLKKRDFQNIVSKSRLTTVSNWLSMALKKSLDMKNLGHGSYLDQASGELWPNMI